MIDLRCRFATPQDAAVLAPLNARLIRDEGHRNPMSVLDLEQRMALWLGGEYEAVLFELGAQLAGYALYRREPEHIYLRQLFVVPALRRRGVGRAALAWLWANAWNESQRLRLDVLVGNTGAQAFWRAVGFTDYCLVMEMERPIPNPTLGPTR
jgi:GNAT superfamily N-acetyltransferase